MNSNFLGKPDREDLQTLDHLRRQLMPVIGVLEKLQRDVAEKTHRGETVEWPQIRHIVSTINAYLSHINAYINGFYKRASGEAHNSDNKTMLGNEKNPEITYKHIEIPGSKDKLDALHVFPMAPFPMMNEQLAGMALTLLDKRLSPTEEKWVEEKLRKAAEFAYVPGEWGIGAKKATIKGNGNASEEDDMKDWDASLPTKRVKGTLTEDDLLQLWGVGHKTAFDRQYQKGQQLGSGQGQGDDGEEDDEDEDMEDVEVEGLKRGPEGTEEEGDEEDEESDDAKPQVVPPVQIIQRAQPSVHQPIPGAPILPLSFVHRFMATGEVEAPKGQR